MKGIHSLPFSRRLLLGFMLVALMPLAISGFSSFAFLEGTLQRQADETAQTQMQEMHSRLEALFDRNAKTSNSICTNRMVSRSFIDNSGTMDANVYLQLYRVSNDLHTGVEFSLYDAGGKRRFSTDVASMPATLPVHWGALRKAKQQKRQIYYNESGEGQPDRLYGVQSLYHFRSMMVGYAVVTVTDSAFDALFAGIASGQGGVLLMDAFGRKIYGAQPMEKEEEAVVREWLAQGGEQPLSWRERRYSVQHSLAAGMYMVLRQPAPLTGNLLGTMKMISLFAGVLSLILSLVVSGLLSRSISQPVKRLSAAMEKVEAGQLDVRVATRLEDELGQLTESFNHMTAQLGQHVRESVRQQEEIQETQIRLLQAQLNPHFLYNTLDTIKWIAKMNGIQEIASITSNLALILRQCVSANQFVTLGQEMEMIRGYVDIQRIRFSGRFRCEIVLPPELENCMLPKLIVQPLAENAIIHGLAEKQTGFLQVKASAEGDVLCIAVTDDGCGMPLDTVERLSQARSKIVEGHLGLYNVNHIIKMNYGSGYGLHAESAMGRGTTVTLRMPLYREDEDV